MSCIIVQNCYEAKAGKDSELRTRWTQHLHAATSPVLLLPHQCCCLTSAAASPVLLLPHQCCCCLTCAAAASLVLTSTCSSSTSSSAPSSTRPHTLPLVQSITAESVGLPGVSCLFPRVRETWGCSSPAARMLARDCRLCRYLII